MPPKNSKKGEKPSESPPRTRSFVLPIIPPSQAKHDAITRAVKRRKRWASGNLEPLEEDQQDNAMRKAAKEAAKDEEKRRREEEREKKKVEMMSREEREADEKREEEAKITEYALQTVRAEASLEEAANNKKELFWLLKQVITTESKRKVR